jgi:hypothetical protein
MSKYQTKIVEALKSGAKLQHTEGKNYKVWLVFPDGSTEKVRRDSAERICSEYMGKLVFGERSGIRWRGLTLS